MPRPGLTHGGVYNVYQNYTNREDKTISVCDNDFNRVTYNGNYISIRSIDILLFLTPVLSYGGKNPRPCNNTQSNIREFNSTRATLQPNPIKPYDVNIRANLYVQSTQSTNVFLASMRSTSERNRYIQHYLRL